MKLHARLVSAAVGDLLRQPGQLGQVHSVFAQAVNVATPRGLVSLVTPGVGALPNGLVLDESFDLRSLGLARGQVVDSEAEGLSVEAAGLSVELRSASRWSPVLGRCELRYSAAEIVDAVRRALASAPESGGFVPLLRLVADGSQLTHTADHLPYPCAQAHAKITRLDRALRLGSEDLDDALAAAHGLIGLGHGLTPSGDDLLVGMSAALYAFGHPLAEAFSQVLPGLARDRTTIVAETFYDYAARGEYSARVHAVFASLDQKRTYHEDLAACLRSSLGWGATSGADCLLGIVLGSCLLSSAYHATLQLTGSMAE